MTSNKKRDYYLKNLENRKAYQKEYRVKNKERIRLYNEKRYEKVKELKREKILDILSILEHKTIECDGKRFYITSNGRFFNEMKELKPSTIRNGYKIIHIGKTRLAHRLVWEVFNGEIPKGMEIDHINTIRGDNRLSNLRIVSSKENKANPITKNRYKDSNKGKITEKLLETIKAKRKKVYQYSLDGELIKEWDSAYEASTNGFRRDSIYDCCKGKQKSHKNFIWKYKKTIK